MFHTGGRVLAITSFGEQAARIVGIEGTLYRGNRFFPFCGWNT